MAKLDRLPCDIWVNVFKYGVLEEALKVHDISKNFQRACGETVRNRLIKLLYQVAHGIPKMQIKLKQSPVADDGLRYSVMHTIIFLRYLQTEINILFSMVWRYYTNNEAWIFLCPYLLPVIEEFDNLFKTCMKLELRRRKLRLSAQNIKKLLYKYHDFSNKFVNNLEEKLLEYNGSTDIETKALDILLSCPSINFQLCLSQADNDKCLYNISSFFGFYNLNPSFQVPDIYKRNLSMGNKKSIITKFLRECVQYENISFLQSITNDISDLELSLEVADNINFQLIQNLCEKYEKIQDTPYSPIIRSCSVMQKGSDRIFSEHYHKCVTYNQDITGLFVLINIPNQSPENFPFIIHSLRGKRKPLLDERVLELEEKQQSFLDCSSILNKPVRHAIHLCMNYWQGFSPSQTVIDVFYDQRSECCISSNNIKYNWDVEYESDEDHQGNFGDVYKGRLRVTEQEVAVKTCRVTVAEEHKRKFLQEGRILKQYDHPNVVKLIGICVQKQPIMIVMELVVGGSLLTYLRNNAASLSTKQFITMCRDAAAGMRYLESKNCIHRDLAARNCLVGDSNIVKISDFGMSREEEEYIVSDGMKQIPIKWTAPEALNFGKYTSLCDVWSYGVLCWEIFSKGGTPYPGLSNTKAREKIDTGYRMPAPEGTPEEMYMLMLRCWEYEPDNRPHFDKIHAIVDNLNLTYR